MGAGKIRGATFGIPVPRSAPFVSYLLSWYEGKTHVGLKSMASCLEDLIQYISTTLLLHDPTQARSSRHSRCTYVVDIRTGEMYRMTRKIYKKTAFLLQMHEVLVRAGATTNEIKLAFVADFLKGRSNKWWWTTRRTQNIDTWDAFVTALRAHASDGGIREARLSAFEEMAQQPGQSDREWKLALLDAHNLIPVADQLSPEQLVNGDTVVCVRFVTKGKEGGKQRMVVTIYALLFLTSNDIS